MKLPISRFTVHGFSMYPTLKPGQNLISFNWAYINRKPEVGDLVIIKIKEREMVKRVGSVSSNQVFVKGDNNQESTDSRHFGPVSMDQVMGKVIWYYGFKQKI